MKTKLFLLVVLAFAGSCLLACRSYHRDDYRGYYKDKDHSEHHYTRKPHRNDE